MRPHLAHLTIHPVGDRAILVDLPGIAEVLRLHAFLKRQSDAGQIDVVPAAQTVLVIADSTAAARRLAAMIQHATLDGMLERDGSQIAARPTRDLINIDVVYDGEDLATAAAWAHMTPEALINMHSGRLWISAFGGFAPGFSYLISEVSEAKYPAIPRRSSPRISVPAGSVAMAGHYSAVYPGPSPGGWQLIGRTAAPLWDPHRASPALISPGNRVQFRPVRELIRLPALTTPGSAAATDTERTTAPTAPSVVVHSPGLQTTIQDLGRPGFAEIGVTGSGALDRAALRRANRLVGNTAETAGLETVLGGLEIEALHDQVLAVTGAPALLTITGTDGQWQNQASETPFVLRAGERLELGQPASGFRCYVAFRGGLDVPRIVSSCSTDLLSGTGPAPVEAGTLLPIKEATLGHIVGNPETPPQPLPEITVFHFVPGPRSDWFTKAALRSFGDQIWTVAPASNRIGLRLEGEPLERRRDVELASEGTVTGAIQVPPSGLPVLFLADHPVTGGYPVIGVVLTADLDQAAQLAPGARIRFLPCPDAGAVPS